MDVNNPLKMVIIGIDPYPNQFTLPPPTKHRPCHKLRVGRWVSAKVGYVEGHGNIFVGRECGNIIFSYMFHHFLSLPQHFQAQPARTSSDFSQKKCAQRFFPTVSLSTPGWWRCRLPKLARNKPQRSGNLWTSPISADHGCVKLLGKTTGNPVYNEYSQNIGISGFNISLKPILGVYSQYSKSNSNFSRNFYGVKTLALAPRRTAQKSTGKMDSSDPSNVNPGLINHVYYPLVN